MARSPLSENFQEAQAVRMTNGKLRVPDHPIVPFIEGDGIGPDVWRAARRVIDAAVEEAYGSRRNIRWMEVQAGEKAFRNYGRWLPEETVKAFED